MTSRPLHVRLEVMVDGHDGALCGDACHYLAHEDRGDGTRYWCTSRADGRMVRALLHRDAETFRSAACRALTAADALNAAVVEAAVNLERNPMSPGAMLRMLENVRALRSAERNLKGNQK